MRQASLQHLERILVRSGRTRHWRGIFAATLAACAALPVLASAGDEPRPAPTPLTLPAGWLRKRAGEALTDEFSLGFTREQLARFGKDAHALRWVMGLFDDASEAPRRTGRPALELAQSTTSAARSLELVLGLADLSAARTFKPAAAGWGVDWLVDGASALDAVRTIASPVGEGKSTWVDRFAELPAEVQQLAVRASIAAIEGERWAVPDSERRRLTAISGLGFAAFASPALPGVALSTHSPNGAGDWYALAVAPWVDSRGGGLATSSAASFRVIAEFDRQYIAYSAMKTVARVEHALAPFAASAGAGSIGSAWDLGADAQLGPIDIPTPRGVLRIAGPGHDAHTGEAWVLIDLGGDDTYAGRFGANLTPGGAALLIDLAGNDRYETDQPVAFGAGVFGLGLLWDMGGDDRYSSRDSSLGSGWFGVGMLIDRGGNDTYQGTIWTQGSGIAGAGLLIDHAGDDRYEANYRSQGAASTLGAGALIDRAGNDQYIARDDGNISALYLNQSVAMSQGCGYGRRADTGDGHSLAGGVGMLVDGAGNDVYHAQVWAQGCGFWWGVGVLHDFSGDDRYRNGKYSAGAAAHFAIGVHVDHAGNDIHNSGPSDSPTAVNQYQGHARDGAIGVFADGGGNDRYMFRNHCAGSADLSSIAIFYEHDGDDQYEYRPSELPAEPGWADTPPLGSTTATKASLISADRPRTLGIFIDASGRDSYIGLAPEQHDGAMWKTRRSADAMGIGMDVSADADRSGVGK